MQVAHITGSRATPRCVRTERLCPGHVHRVARRRTVLVRAADNDKDDFISGAMKAASGLVDKATDLVPESVPRSTAKAGFTLAGVMVVFWLLQKVISGVLTLAVMGGIGYYFLTKQQGDDKDEVIDVTPTSKKSKSKEDLDDPLAEARRIMDKYK